MNKASRVVAAQVLKNPAAICMTILTIPACIGYCYIVFNNLPDLIETASTALALFLEFQSWALICICEKFYTDFKTISVMPIKKEKAVKIYIAEIAVFTLVQNLAYVIFGTVKFSQGSIDLMQFISHIMLFIGYNAVTVTLLCLYTVKYCVYVTVKNHSNDRNRILNVTFSICFLGQLLIREVIEMPIVFYGIKAVGLIAVTIFALAAVVVSVIVVNRTARRFYL
jgi:hypothetical protein